MRKILIAVISIVMLTASFAAIYGHSMMASIKGQAAAGSKGAKMFKAPGKADVDVTKKYIATIETSKGNIVCELFAKDAPISVTNFKQLADGGFYDGLTFHRVEPDFVIQGGDPDGTGRGGPGYTIPAEIGLKHTKGALAWARLGDNMNPKRESSGSQFYITLEAVAFLDGAYTVFGQTISGMDVVAKIARGDIIKSIKVSVE